MRKTIAEAGNTVVPALLALEQLGFHVLVCADSGGQVVLATRGDEEYVAEDPVGVLGLINLVEIRGWQWKADDDEVAVMLQKHHLAV